MAGEIRDIQDDELSPGGAPSISAAKRVFTIIEELSRVKSARLESLAARTGLAKPTAWRFLNTLRELGYVWRDEGDRWYLGLKLFSVGSRALDHLQLPEVARPIAEALSTRLGEAVHLGILDEDEALYILKIESRYTIRMYSRVGKHIPLYCTAIGKILLADMDEGSLSSWLEGTRLVPFTPKTLTTPAALRRELDRVRAQGWAADAQEHEEGVTCMGMPIRDHSGRAIAAISVSWPVFRFDESKAGEYRSAILDATSRIGSVLGNQG